MKADIATYVSKCLTCEKNKAEHQKPSGLHNNLRFQSGSGKGLLWILHGVPVSIISDRNSHFSQISWRIASEGVGTIWDMIPLPPSNGMVKVERQYKRCEVGDSQLTGPELIRDTTEKIIQIKNPLLAVRSRQKSYADKRLKPLEFEVGDMVLLKFGLPEELKGIHSTFHVSNLKKCLAEGDVVVPMEEIQLDDKLYMIKEPFEIVDRQVKRLKQSRIPIVKVRWNSQRGPEFTWEREDQIKKKYPRLFTSKDKSERVDETS
ncbi:hypothetical protein Tco_0674138 [Tanacetum coccineum]